MLDLSPLFPPRRPRAVTSTNERPYPEPRQPYREAAFTWPHPDPNAEARAKGRRAAELEHGEKQRTDWIAGRLDAIADDLRRDADEPEYVHACSLAAARAEIEALAREVRGTEG